MPETRFRVWDSEEKRMRDDFLIKANGELLILDKENHTEGSLNLKVFLLEDMEMFTISKHTGLIDARKKDIYEGDIMKSNHPYDSVRIVVWTGSSYQLKSISYNAVISNTECIDFISQVVIGNIFENPELLGKK